MNPSIETFNTLISDIVQQIEIVEHDKLASGVEAAQRRYAAEERLRRLLDNVMRFAIETGLYPRMQGIIIALEERIERLPQGPGFPVIREAQSLSEFSNLAILAAEERFLTEQVPPELTRLVITDGTGNTLFDRALPCVRTASLSFAYQQGGALPAPDTQAFSAMITLWPDLLSVVKGRFILAENIFLTQVQLIFLAERFGLEAPVIIGESMLTLCQRYITGPSLVPAEAQESPCSTDLLTVAKAFGIPLPGLPHPTALERAGAMLQLLRAMARGVVPECLSQEYEEHTDHNDIDH